MKKTSMARKVPVEGLIDVLMELYESGAMYVDLFCINEQDTDTIMVAVKEEYMGLPPEKEEDDDVVGPISDDLLNELT